MVSQPVDTQRLDGPAQTHQTLEHGIARGAVVMVLAASSDFRGQVCGILQGLGYRPQVLADAAALWDLGQPHASSCLLCSHPLPDGTTGLQMLREIRKRQWLLPTILLASEWDVPLVVNAMREGADDFLTLPLDTALLRDAVTHALSEAQHQFTQTSAIAEAKERAATLDAREMQVVKLVLCGLLNKEIADELNLALVTIKVYRGRAMKKLGAGNAAELARIASLAGISDGLVT